MRPESETSKFTSRARQRLNQLIRFFIFLAPVLILPNTTLAARTSYNGLSGLPFMSTADVVYKGELDIHFREGAERYEQQGVVDHVGKSAISVTYGAWKNLEVAGQIPHSYKEGIGYSGVPYFTVASKYRFLGGRKKFYALAVSAVGNFGAANVEHNIGSGENGYAFGLHASLYGGTKVGWHIMLGREKSDRKSLLPGAAIPVTTTTTTMFESVTKNVMAVGFEYEMDPDLFLSLEAEGSITTEDEDDNGILSLGIRYQADTALSYAMGIGFGLPDERSQPQIRALAGISYSFGKPHAPTRAAARPTSRPQPRRVQTRRAAPAVEDGYVIRDGYKVRADIHNVPAARTQARTRQPVVQKSAPRQVARKPVPKTKRRPVTRKPVTKKRTKRVAQKPKPAPRKQYVSDVRIDIWNASGIKGLGLKVANRLKKKGYRIARVKTTKRRQKQSMIFYAPGYSKQAVKIGHSIWEDQDVRGTSKLRKGIEIQIIVGYDLK
jgi:hypothetical protein